jgi:hypothetical protein
MPWLLLTIAMNGRCGRKLVHCCAGGAGPLTTAVIAQLCWLCWHCVPRVMAVVAAAAAAVVVVVGDGGGGGGSGGGGVIVLS